MKCESPDIPSVVNGEVVPMPILNGVNIEEKALVELTDEVAVVVWDALFTKI